MRTITLWACMLAAGLWAQAIGADIYTWVDINGVRQITNLNPPPQAEIFLHTPEDPPPGSTQERRSDAEKREHPVAAAAQMREREERLARQAAGLERRIEAAGRAVEETIERAQARLRAAEARRDRELGYATPLVIVTRPSGDRQGHHRAAHGRAGNRPGTSSIEGRPFHLAPIRIPLSDLGSPSRRTAADGDRISRSRRGEGQSRLQGHRSGAPRPERRR